MAAVDGLCWWGTSFCPSTIYSPSISACLFLSPSKVTTYVYYVKNVHVKIKITQYKHFKLAKFMYIFITDMETPLRWHMPSLAWEAPKSNTKSNVNTNS